MKRLHRRPTRPGSMTAMAVLVWLLIGAGSCGTHDNVGKSDAGQTPALDGRAGGGAAPDGAAPDGAAGAGGSTDSGAARPDGPGRGDGAAPIADGPSGPDVTAGPEGVNASAFDRIAGALNVDYPTYMSKHDIVYNRPNPNPLFGLPVGNGRMGAMVWSANGLTMQVGAVDASQQSAFASGLVNLNTTPALDANTTGFQQILSLYDGTLTTSYDADRTVTIMGSPDSEVMGIHVVDARPGVSAVAVQLSLWDVSALANSGNVPNLNAWRAVSAYADATSAGFSRGQADPQNFGYTLAATVEGTPFTTQMVGPNTVRLNITPASSYTIWFTSATRLNAPNHDSVAQARSLLLAVKDAGYAATLGGFKNFWHDFWRKSFLQYSGLAGDADYLETFYYLTTYEIACGGFANYPFHFINGVFRATADDTKWSNAYWYWNQRDVYNSFLASNHADMLAVFNNMYSRNASALKAYTMTRYNVAGIWVPETMGWDGNASGTIGSDFTKNIYSTGAEAAQNMYMQYAYTGDSTYLSATAYPFIRDAANLYVGVLARDAGTGAYSMALSNSHETYWNVRNAITDLAAVRMLFPIAIKVSEALGLDANLRTTWQDVLDHLVPYPTDATDYLPHESPISMTHNNENVASELIWPYNASGIGTPDYQRALSTWNRRPFPYGNVWSPDAIQAARLGLGDQAYQGMKTMLGRYQNYPNGFTNNTNGVFEYGGVHLSVVNESLLQSYNDKIRVFPAVPADASFVGRFTLAAKGGFRVSSERESGEVKYVGISSVLGNAATVVNPWGTQAMNVRRQSDGMIVQTSSAAEVTFPTTGGEIYVVERTAKPLSNYAYALITGTPNRAVKRLSNPVCTLGM